MKITLKYIVSPLKSVLFRAECFALLGGAGKTSIFSMLMGDKKITSGDAFVQGFSLRTEISKVNKSIGYCPEFNALLKELTVSQTLEIFASIRGIGCNDIESLSEFLANELQFQDDLHQPVSKLSDENRKKLGIAIALIGNPVVIFLGIISIVWIVL